MEAAVGVQDRKRGRWCGDAARGEARARRAAAARGRASGERRYAQRVVVCGQREVCREMSAV